MAACSTVIWPIPQAQSIPASAIPLRLEWQADDDLVKLARAGEAQAFAELIRRHQPLCQSKARSILKNFSDAEDEVQNAWVQVWMHLDSYRSQGAFRAWVARIVVNRCFMRLRSIQTASTTSIDEMVQSKGTFRLEVVDPSALPEEAVRESQILRAINKEVGAIPPLLRKVLVMRDLDDISLEDIAGQLGISVSAAKSRLLRARAELKKRLQRYEVEYTRSALRQRSVVPRVVYIQS